MKQYGAGQNIVPELAIQEALQIGLYELAGDPAALEECVQRSDGLRYSTAEEWRREMVEAARIMLDPAAPGALRISLSYAEAIAAMPSISIELAEDNEDQGEATMGDELGRWYEVKNEKSIAVLSIDGAVIELLPGYGTPEAGERMRIRSADGLTAEDLDVTAVSEGTGPNDGDEVTVAAIVNTYAPDAERVVVLPEQGDRESMSIRHKVIGVGWNSTVLIGCYDPAVERAFLLQALVRATLFRQKGLLFQKGIGDVSFSGGAIQPAEELKPRVGVIPTVRVSLRWHFRTTKSKIVPNRITIGDGRFSTG